MKTNVSRLVTQVLEMNILELNRHGWTCVQLKCEDAGIGSMGCILIHDDGGHPAIDHVHEAILVGDDMIVIPVFLLDFILNTCRSTQGSQNDYFVFFTFWLDGGHLPTLSQDAASFLFIKNA